MASTDRFTLSLLLVLVIGGLANGQTVLYDFEDLEDPFLHFGQITTGVGGELIPDCGTIGNVCVGHTGDFTEESTEPHKFGIGELGPDIGSTTIDLTPYIGYSIEARFIRDTDGMGGAGEPLFTGLSPIKFGVQWDETDSCDFSMNECSDLYDTPVQLTEEFQTFTVMFDDFLQGKPRNAAQIKMLMLTGDFDPDSNPNRKLVSGDFNANSSVDGGDFLDWQRNLGATDPKGGAPRFADGNANLDQNIDGLDLAIWQDQFGRTDAPISDWSDGVGRLEFDNIIGILPPPIASANAVPEPSSVWLIVCCVSALGSSIRSNQLLPARRWCRVG